MLTPAIRAIRYPSSAPQGANRPISSLESPAPNEKPTRARMRRRKPVDRDRAADRNCDLTPQVKARWPRYFGVVTRCRKSASTRSSSSASLLKGLHALIEIAGGIALYLVQHRDDRHRIDRWSYDDGRATSNDWIANCSTSPDLLGQRASFLRFLPAQPRHREIGWSSSACCARSCGPIRRASPCSARSSPTSSTATATPTTSALILLSVFDLFVIDLAVHEYRLLRTHLPTH